MTTSTRRVVNSTFISLDGLVERLEDWHFGYHGEEGIELAEADLNNSGTVLMGRQTYESFAAVWPTVDSSYAARMNELPKLVASTTLSEPEWNNSAVIDGDLAVKIATLKSEPGLDIISYGFGPVARTLVENGLLDELKLWIHPVLVGKGGPSDLLFRDGFDGAFELTDHRALGSGVLVATYQPVR